MRVPSLLYWLLSPRSHSLDLLFELFFPEPFVFDFALPSFIWRRYLSRRSRLSSQKRRYSSIQLAASLGGSASSLQGRHCASRPRAISPARSSTFRCFDTAGIDISNGSASSVTDVSPSASRARMARRVGSASAENVALS